MTDLALVPPIVITPSTINATNARSIATIRAVMKTLDTTVLTLSHARGISRSVVALTDRLKPEVPEMALLLYDGAALEIGKTLDTMAADAQRLLDAAFQLHASLCEVEHAVVELAPEGKA